MCGYIQEPIQLRLKKKSKFALISVIRLIQNHIKWPRTEKSFLHCAFVRLRSRVGLSLEVNG